jgi:hypothetical protein
MALGRRFAFAISTFVFILLLVSGSSAQSAVQLKVVYGKKFPNTPEEGLRPVASKAFAPVNPAHLMGFNELVPYVTPSPDQDEAGTCLFMSLTGVSEWWMMRLGNSKNFVQDGPFDLSERWWVNQSIWSGNLKRIKNWSTDGIYLFNAQPAALNRQYRFTKGWYMEEDDELIKVPPHTPGAKYDTGFNWIDDSDRISAGIRLPKFNRRVIYADLKENPWEIGQAPKDIVERVKEALVKEKSPVQVVYNHEGFWHSVYVIGFDDTMSSQNCPFLKESFESYSSEARKAQAEADKTNDPKEKDRLLKRVRRFAGMGAKLNSAMQRGGGCHPNGMFYVRDSQYSDPSEPIYHYDLSNPSADKPYSKRIILREFDWLRYMANHVTVITAEIPNSIRR